MGPTPKNKFLATLRLGVAAIAFTCCFQVVDALAAPAPPIAARYMLADEFLRSGIDQLVLNADLRARFTQDGKGVFYRLGPAGKRDYLLFDLTTGTRRVIANEADLAAKLTAATGTPFLPSNLRLEEADVDTVSGDFRFQIGNKRWTLQRDGKLALADHSATSAPQGVVSPDGRYEVLARNYNLIARDLKSGREVPLTKDGTREQPYGRGIPQLDQILREGTEEPEMPVSVRWSPDGRYIATWRLDTRGVEKLSMTQQNPPGKFMPRSFHYIYPLAGAERLPQATRLAIDIEAAFKKGQAKPVTLQIPSESLLYPADPDYDWQDGKIRAMWTERGYVQQVVYHADPATGAVQVVAREKVKPLVTVTSSSLMPAPTWSGELSISERSGWAQLYLVTPDNPDGGRALTTGEWEVLSVDHVDDAARSLLVTGVGREKDRNPYYRALYRVSVDGGDPLLLTPEPLDHDIKLSDDGKYFIDMMSSPTEPTRTLLRSTADGRVLAELGRADATALFAKGFTPPEPFQGLAADGKTPIYGMIWRPANFDATRSYPVIDEVYTGPTTTNVPVTWNETIFAGAASVAQIGAVVVNVDGRGTSRRGQAFRLHAYQNLGEVGLDDHIALIKQMAAKYSYIDTNRVGVYGGSAGGYDTARFLLRRPEFFKVGVSSSGNHDLRLDKAWWPEVSMGNPDIAVWDRNSNMSVAANLTGKLLLIHGDIDDNVPVTESFRLAQALINAGRDVDLVILPNTTHAVVQPFYWRKLRDYFTRNLLDEAPPALPPPAANTKQ